jgi:HSP20 family protein
MQSTLRRRTPEWACFAPDAGLVIVRNPRTPRPGESGTQRFGEFADRLHGDHWQPDVDVFETEDAVVVRAELAGVRRGDLRVTVDGDLLRIRGLREGSGAAAVRLHQMEIATGPFERCLRVPADVDRDRVTAHLEDGLLTVTLGRRKPVRRNVPVERE